MDQDVAARIKDDLSVRVRGSSGQRWCLMTDVCEFVQDVQHHIWCQFDSV